MKKGFILGLIISIVLIGTSLAIANSQIQAILNEQIKVTLNGQVQEFKDETTNETQYPITYKDRTYLPLRTVANLVGVDVDYDANNNTAILKTKDYVEAKANSYIFPLTACVSSGFCSKAILISFMISIYYHLLIILSYCNNKIYIF